MSEGKEIAKSKAQERQQKLIRIRRRRRTQLLVIVTVLLALILGIFQLFRSGLINIKKVEVVGNKSVSTAKIIEACRVDKHTNLLSVSTSDISSRILKNPWIKNVTIKRIFPHTLKVEVQERVPVAIVSQDEKFYLVDDDLFVISKHQYANNNSSIPTITDLPIGKIWVGEQLMNDSLKNAIKCIKSMDPAFKKTISLISAPSPDKLSLYTKDNVEILYGEAKQADDKNKVLQTILKEQGKQVIFIDVRSYPHSDPVLRRMDSVP